jgi:hypothetical protein
MMGGKERSFTPLIHVSLEDLVPADHFYRHLERSLDLSFVREAGAADLREWRPPLDRPSRVLQAATRHVF